MSDTAKMGREREGPPGRRPLVDDELADHRAQVILPGGDGGGVVGAGGQVPGITGVVGAQVVGPGWAGDAAHAPLARTVRVLWLFGSCAASAGLRNRAVLAWALGAMISTASL